MAYVMPIGHADGLALVLADGATIAHRAVFIAARQYQQSDLATGLGCRRSAPPVHVQTRQRHQVHIGQVRQYRLNVGGRFAVGRDGL